MKLKLFQWLLEHKNVVKRLPRKLPKTNKADDIYWRIFAKVPVQVSH